ncbi:MAG: adenosylmethionine decarboxylase [Candidatus Staskawiczbacteria bacterium]|nr:adenosylmethionine decarboxylase [Candidatus Staskawiczbacteria bacterium]
MVIKPKRTKKYEIGRDPMLFQNRNQAGVHLLVDFWFGKNIEDEEKIEKILLEAGKRAKSTPLKTSVYKFDPQGVTGIVLLSESHISLHSWPEIGYMGVDIFTCGEHVRPYEALEYLKNEFNPKKVEVKEVRRGVIGNY